MEGPWFRKHPWFLYLPIRREGVAVIAAVIGVAIPFGLVSVFYIDRYPIIGWGSGIVSAATVFAGHAVVVWKLERNYGHGGDPRPDSRHVRYGCIAQAIFMLMVFVVMTLLMNIRR
jgi:amino acid transporter